jgi:membrane protein YqaA with SNARE-associated domain
VIDTVLAALGVCLLSAVVPFVNAELYLLAASSLVAPQLAPALVVAGALGQMLGKSLMYHAGRGALRLPSERLRRMVASVEERYRQGGTGGAAVGGTVILASAGIGLPPFYVVSIACGILRIPFALFFSLGLIGRLARFGVIVLGPQLVRLWGLP